MKGYGLPANIDISNPEDSLIELLGLKNGCSEEKRNTKIKRTIRKSLKHSERFKTKRKLMNIICILGY